MIDPQHPAAAAMAVTMDVARRAERLRARFADLGLDAMVVADPTNVRWLTGFTGSNAMVLVTETAMVVATDGRYTDQAPAQIEAAAVPAEVVIGPDLVTLVAGMVGATSSVGLEAASVSWALQRRLEQAVDADVVPVDDVLVGLRAVKDAGELARIRAAASIADATLADVAPMLDMRPTEREVALALDHGMQYRGAAAAAYETIVASGPNGALPHARPTDRTIVEGDLVVIDVGALVDGYRSDMTRTFVVGEPTARQRRQLDVVRESQAAGAATVAAGVAAIEVDNACRAVISDAGWADAFTHGTGHGVGLDIHELPRVNSRSDDTLEAGMIVTVEPGVYLAGEGGVRWEDLLHVTRQGSECLSGSPKDPRPAAG